MFKVETKEIYIYPLGGITKMNMSLNINPIKEMLILIMGPVFQTLAYFLLINFFKESLVHTYHIGILMFNLLPIYPLDGGKMLNILLNNLFSFKHTLEIVIRISYITTIIILFSNNKLSINMITTYILLVVLIRKEELKVSLVYQKFILERIKNDYSKKKKKLVKNINNLYRYRYNLIKDSGIIYDERAYLYKKYKKN